MDGTGPVGTAASTHIVTHPIPLQTSSPPLPPHPPPPPRRALATRSRSSTAPPTWRIPRSSATEWTPARSGACLWASPLAPQSAPSLSRATSSSSVWSRGGARRWKPMPHASVPSSCQGSPRPRQSSVLQPRRWQGGRLSPKSTSSSWACRVGDKLLFFHLFTSSLRIYTCYYHDFYHDFYCNCSS
jgi:hypothetical protein